MNKYISDKHKCEQIAGVTITYHTYNFTIYTVISVYMLSFIKVLFKHYAQAAILYNIHLNFI